jgi:deoxyribodipyrimidine photo-lyase
MAGIVWFRRDLRLADNPAWSAATREHDRLTALFVIDPSLWDRVSQKRRDLLGSHLGALDNTLQGQGGRLRIERGDPIRVLGDLADGQPVYWNNDYTPFARRRDAAVAERVGHVSRHEGSYIHSPSSILKHDGSQYRVFTAYWRAWIRTPWNLPLQPDSVAIAADPGEGRPSITAAPLAGEFGAHKRLEDFMSFVDDYDTLRDLPAADATSRLSADLKFGTIAPHRIAAEIGEATPGRRSFVRQLAWRDFYAQVLEGRPDTVDAAYRAEYSSIPWANDDEGFDAWTTGRTGFPIVDAGMRQLANDGFMHNRVRMVAASFLVKDLLIDWRRGERWFRHHLIDGDVAQNVGNWQWVAGTGVDAAPYFRVFNPTTQSRRFDPDGEYIRKWVPELRIVSKEHIHDPWGAAVTRSELAAALTNSGYPKPIVDHGEARIRTLEVYGAAKRSR